MFDKMHEKLDKINSETTKAVNVFVSTIKKLEGHNAELTNMKQECGNQIDYYNNVNNSIIDKIQQNQNVIDKIKSIVGDE